MKFVTYYLANGRIEGVRGVHGIMTADGLLDHVFGVERALYGAIPHDGSAVDVQLMRVVDGKLALIEAPGT